MSKSTANSDKPKPRGKPFPKGTSGNPAGAPKRGQSWAELFNTIGDYTGEEVAQLATNIAAKLKKLPKGVTLKQLVVIRAYTALLDESNARLLKEVMDRAEGRTAQVIEGAGSEGEIVLTIKTE